MNATKKPIATAFDDLEDDLNAAPAAPLRDEVKPVAVPKKHGVIVGDHNQAPASGVYKESCPDCGGTGRWRGVQVNVGHNNCFKCEGKGYLLFKTSPEARAKQRKAAVSAKQRKEDAKQAQIAAFSEQYPQVVEWWTGSTFEFAISLREALHQYGSLTPNQLAAALRCVEKLAAAKAERAAAQAKVLEAAPEINVAPIETAFASAIEKGIKKPHMRLANFKFSLAPASGRNAGSIYVVEKDSDQYLGKVQAGKFVRVRECSDEQQATVLEVCADPKQAAIAYGRRTGCCAICGRELTNSASIDLGIGPICAEKMGW